MEFPYFEVAVVFAAFVALAYLLRDEKKTDLFKEEGAYGKKEKSRRRQIKYANGMACLFALAVFAGWEFTETYGLSAGGGHPLILFYFAAHFLIYWAGRVADPRWFLGQCIALAIIGAATFLPFL